LRACRERGGGQSEGRREEERGGRRKGEGGGKGREEVRGGRGGCGVAGWCPSGEDGRVRGRLSDGGRVSWLVDWDLFGFV